MPRPVRPKPYWFLDFSDGGRGFMHEFPAASENRAKSFVRKKLLGHLAPEPEINGVLSLCYGELDDPVPMLTVHRRYAGRIEFALVDEKAST